VITIEGTGFGTDPTAATVVSVGGASCGIVQSAEWIIQCTVPPGTGSSVPVVVTAYEQPSIPHTIGFGYAAPTIEAITPTEISTSGGTLVTITGSNFGEDPSLVTVTVGSVACTALQMSATHIECVAPEGTNNPVAVIATVDGQPSGAYDGNFDYAAPSINLVTPPTIAAAGGTAITITGADFGTNAALVTVTIESADCPVASAAGTVVTCTAPSGTSKPARVIVTVEKRSSDPFSGSFGYSITESKNTGDRVEDGDDREDGNGSSSGDGPLASKTGDDDVGLTTTRKSDSNGGSVLGIVILIVLLLFFTVWFTLWILCAIEPKLFQREEGTGCSLLWSTVLEAEVAPVNWVYFGPRHHQHGFACLKKKSAPGTPPPIVYAPFTVLWRYLRRGGVGTSGSKPSTSREVKPVLNTATFQANGLYEEPVSQRKAAAPLNGLYEEPVAGAAATYDLSPSSALARRSPASHVDGLANPSYDDIAGAVANAATVEDTYDLAGGDSPGLASGDMYELASGATTDEDMQHLATQTRQSAAVVVNPAYAEAFGGFDDDGGGANLDDLYGDMKFVPGVSLVSLPTTPAVTDHLFEEDDANAVGQASNTGGRRMSLYSGFDNGKASSSKVADGGRGVDPNLRKNMFENDTKIYGDGTFKLEKPLRSNDEFDEMDI
jgi:hypothetical protein